MGERDRIITRIICLSRKTGPAADRLALGYCGFQGGDSKVHARVFQSLCSVSKGQHVDADD